MATAELSDLQKLELKEAFDEFDKVNFTIIMKLIYKSNVAYNVREIFASVIVTIFSIGWKRDYNNKRITSSIKVYRAKSFGR